MKSNVPWSVKGIERDARETAKAAAQREGMTVGEWLNQVIYTAGDPNAEPTQGEIEGLRARDLAAAIEHLSRRIAGAEAKSAEAVEGLARSVGGAVERLQRLERANAADGSPADIVQRIETLEAKSVDRQRIDALRALEKAVGQVAVQFSNAQSSMTARLETAEKRLQTLADRIETGGPAAEGVSADTVRQAFDSMAERIDRAEKIAREAAALKAEASASTDADFVQKTGIRLRILGDEIKRSGDQIRALEGTIGRLGDQIDAAERRSAEGVQKVADTIADIREKFAGGDQAGDADMRAEIDAAIADIAERTEGRIAALQRAFDDIARKLEGGAVREAPAPRAAAFAAPQMPQAARAVPQAPIAIAAEPEIEADAEEEIGFDAELEEAFSALDAPEPVEAEAEPAAASDDDFGFDLDDAPHAKAGEEALDDETNDVLSEIREAFGLESAPAVEADEDDETGAPAEEFAAAELPPVVENSASEAVAQTPKNQGDYLKSARLAAREAAAKAAAEESAGKRKLTPKQRAILAARVKRRRMEEEQRRLASETVVEPVIGEEDEDGEQKPSVKARVLAAVARMKSRGGNKDEAGEETPGAPTLDDEDAKVANPNIMGGASSAFKSFRALPFSGGVMSIGIVIVLLGAALFFFAKDLLAPSGAKRPAPQPAQAVQTAPANDSATQAAAPVSNDTATAPAVRDDTAAATNGILQPRQLYLENIEALKTAETDADAKAALSKIEQAAALGHPPAQLQIGELYKIGQIYPKDLARARQWFERAANGGNVLAMHRLGVMAARGEGGPVDPKASIAWFEKAASYGLVDSEYNLGATYHPTPEGTPGGVQNAGLAYYWYSIAAKNGDSQAAEMAVGLSAQLSPSEKAQKDAEIAAWAPKTPDPIANENAPAR